MLASLIAQLVKNPQWGDLTLIPGSERSAGEGIGYPLQYSWASLVAQLVKKSTCNTGDLGLIPGFGRSPGEGKGYPLQYSGLENSMDCIVQKVAKSQPWLTDFDFTSKICYQIQVTKIFPSTKSFITLAHVCFNNHLVYIHFSTLVQYMKHKHIEFNNMRYLLCTVKNMSLFEVLVVNYFTISFIGNPWWPRW